MSPPDAATQRVGRALQTLCLTLSLVLTAEGLPFVLMYRSEEARYWGFSSRYLIGVVAPAGLLAAGLIALALARDVCARLARGALGRLPRGLAAAALFMASAGSLIYAFTISDEYVSVLLMVLLPCAAGLVFSLAVPDGAPASWLLACPAPLLCGIVLFGAELPAWLAGSPLAVWGDASTFATLFPREPPFIGPGGRLRPRLDVRMRAPEYRSGARLVTNAEGFRNEGEFEPEPPAGALRILSLGDSFSTGFSADQERFFGSLLQQRLAAGRDGSVEVMNAEVSDPAYGLFYLQRHGIRRRPALVICGLSGNDLMQAEQFYGEDRLFRLEAGGRLVANPRFDPSIPDAWTRYRDVVYPAAVPAAPAGLRLTARLLAKLVRFRLLSALASAAETAGDRPTDMVSYAEPYERGDGHKRLIDGAANLGFFYRRSTQPVERMYAAGFDLLAAMDRTARAGGARFLLVLYPQRFQVQPRDWEAIRRRWALKEEDFDLELPDRRLADFCARAGIACCDLLEAFRAAAPQGSQYLPGGDTHFNRRGHETAAAAVKRCVETLIEP